MKMQESGENYLETILVLKREKGAVRSIDIAQRMNFTKPSISRAMSLLRENGYITMDESMFIELTDGGHGNCAAHLRTAYPAHPIFGAVGSLP